MNYALLDTPVGPVAIVGDDSGLRHIDFRNGQRPLKIEKDWKRDDTVLKPALDQLTAYFAGELRRFDLPLAPEGTLFQKTVWKALQKILYGRVATYKQIAEKIGKPKAARAVGGANGRNPLPIVIPCHRIIGADGSLTGFSSGLQIKEQLLALEGVRMDYTFNFSRTRRNK